VLNTSFWDWFITNPAIICPIGICSVRSTAGTDMTPCLTVSGLGIVTLHTSLAGCPVANGNVDVECSYNWPGGHIEPPVDGSNFKVTITPGGCSAVTFN
jgi:hypothetical protein